MIQDVSKIVRADADMTKPATEVALVVIGRNEGERLKRCLQSATGQAALIVYVDSDSKDQSVAYAKATGADVIALDMSKPFSAARARNEGWRHALKQKPEVRYIQFVDGDCEICPGWLQKAYEAMTQRADLAAVCGRRRERFPNASVYNSMCDLEWNTPIGEAKAFGGDVMIRASAITEADGYRDDVIAGEEPELCVRLRAAGGKIWRLDADMTLHDAAIARFGQWWMRAVRGGYAFALGAHLHGATSERHWVKETRRAVAWGGILPTAIAASTIWINPLLALCALIYPLQMGRLVIKSTLPRRQAWVDAWFKTLSKFAEMQGVARFWRDRWSNRAPSIIEYK